MKFINYLESIAGVGIFPLVSLCIFFLFFVILIIWVLQVSKEHLTEMKNIPFTSSSLRANSTKEKGSESNFVISTDSENN